MSVDRQSHVSIHARHYWRAILSARGFVTDTTGFQSTPAITGERFKATRTLLASTWFQSTPAITGERFVALAVPLVMYYVSIHARHYWRAIHRSFQLHHVAYDVSIHARHYWRAIPSLAATTATSFIVSIHARHYWRAIRNGACRLLIVALFQSTPAITGERFPNMSFSCPPC